MMDLRARVNAISEPLPGAALTHPFDSGHDAWRVGDKMFTMIGSKGEGVSVKTPDTDTAAMLIEAGAARKAAYFHRSWVNLPDEVEEDELRHRIHISYDTVRASLTKKAQTALAPREKN